MTNLHEKIAAELKVRELLKREGVPPADWVEYGHTCIRLFWEEPQVALVVDLDELVEAGEEPVATEAPAPGNAPPRVEQTSSEPGCGLVGEGGGSLRWKPRGGSRTCPPE